MKNLEELYDLIPGTFVVETLTQLRDIYDELETATENFRKNYHISCPEGCGSCCERFVPDITPAEARMVAAYLLFVKQDMEALKVLESHLEGVCFAGNPGMDGNGADAASLTGCPLYDPDNPYHCTVYPARPLICRLFAASASDSKAGSPVFRRCKLDVENTMPLYLDLSDADPALGDIPLMRDYGFRVRAIGGGNDEIQLLPKAVLEAVAQLRFIARMLGIGESPDSNPDDTPTPTPTPIAS
jgi:Fe-S-cluster containining protein